MRTRNVTARFVIGAIFSALVGCGGGGGGGGVNGGAGGTAAGTLSGVATKAPISGGTVKVFEIISSATSNPRANVPRLGTTVLAQGTTADDGSYSLTLPAGTTGGALLVQVTGGSYHDEATAGTKLVATEFGEDGMRAIVRISDSARQSGQISGTVTPFTDMAYKSVGASLTDGAIAAANGKVASAFGLSDIVGVKPLDPNKPFPAGAEVEAEKYALALAGLSQYQKEHGGGRTISEIGKSLSDELASGGLSPQTETEMKSSSNNYVGSGNNPNPVLGDPAVNPTAPAALSATPAAPVSLALGASQEIAASVTTATGAAVPDGTQVSFSTNLGSFSASSALPAVSVATVNGIAKASLTSSAVGAAVVTLKSGTATGSASVSFFDPNAPASISMSAAPSSAIASGAPVLISANVTRVAGGAVPNGTSVSFSITSGSGSLAAATTTVGGVATVQLSSSSAGTVTVMASAGSVIQAISIPFSSQPTTAIVKVRTTGTLPASTLIGGINATVTYAGGKGLSILPANIVSSGAGAGSFMEKNANTLGRVVLGLINTDGIAAGEFATLTFSIAAGNFPTAADFGISSTGLSIINTSTVDIPGMGADVSVTIQ